MRSLCALLAATAATLVVTGSALGAFSARLTALNFDPVIGEQLFDLAVSPPALPTAKTTIYVGAGDTIDLPGGGIGKEIGGAVMEMQGGPNYGNSEFELFGVVTVGNPAAFTNNACSPGSHDAVWILDMEAPTGTEIKIPMFVDEAAPAEQGFASYRLEFCLASPFVPPPVGALFEERLVEMVVFLGNFKGAVPNRWTAVVTPHRPGTTQPEPLSTVEAQSIVSQAAISHFKAKRLSKKQGHQVRYFARISGIVKENGKGTAAEVQMVALRRRSARIVARRKTSASGRFSVIVRLKSTARFGVIAFHDSGFIGIPQCDPVLDIGFGPLPCSTITTSGFFVAKLSKKVRVPKSKHRALSAREAQDALRLFEARTFTFSHPR